MTASNSKYQMDPEVLSVFQGIPVSEILEKANSFVSRIQAGDTAVQAKELGEIFTEADICIQDSILDYFSQSTLAGRYTIKAEEVIAPKYLKSVEGAKPWQLIVDPIDGTNAFCDGLDEWGTCIGLCDQEGILRFSWNMLASGKIFSTTTAIESELGLPWCDRLKSSAELVFDIYDYGAGAADRFPKTFRSISNNDISTEAILVESCPSGVVAGSKLYNGEIDGLLWLSSEKGKRNYPDYDLIMVGALYAQGWKVAIGKKGESVELLVIAPSEKDLSLLWNVGLSLLPSLKKESIQQVRELAITSSS